MPTDALTIEGPSPRQTWAMNLSLMVVGLAGAATLAYEHGGFELPDRRVGWLHLAQIAVAAFFVLDFFARMFLSGRVAAYLRRGWLDLALLAMFAAGLAAGCRPVLLLHGYLGAVILLRALGGVIVLAGTGLSPVWMLAGGLLMLGATGSGLLMLPAATRPIADKPFYCIDALFVALSAACSTGLPLRDLGAAFTPFGQTVILCLIQVGGLGTMICGTLLATRIGRGLLQRNASLMDPRPHPATAAQPGRIALLVVLATLGIELVGAAMLYPMFADLPGAKANPAEAVWYSLFHSVSAFCNAGFSLYRDNLAQGANGTWPKALREHWQVLGVMGPLIVLGGLGFPVLQDCARWLRGRVAWRPSFAAMVFASDRMAANDGRHATRFSHPYQLSLHARLVLAASVTLIVLGASGLMILERPVSVSQPAEGSYAAPIQGPGAKRENDWFALGFEGRVREAFFQSVSARTGGFRTIDLGRLSNGGKLWMSGLMVVGAGPAGTGGGMKTVTFSLLLLTVWSVLCRRREVELFDRSLGDGLVRKGMAMAALYLGLVAAVALAMTLTMDPRESFIDLLFESCSACGNVGLSTGLTAKLTQPAKIVLMAGMYLGRIGPMALLLVMTLPPRKQDQSLPPEDVLIG